MRKLSLITRYLLSSCALASLFLSGQLMGQEDSEMQVLRAKNHDFSSSRERNKNKTCPKKPNFASFRSTFTGIVRAGGTIPFNLPAESNQGNAVKIARSEFVIKKSGYYMINYGVNSSNLTETIEGKGISLRVTSGGLELIKGSILVNSSESLIVLLKAGDRVRLEAQEDVQLIFGGVTTSFCDTAYITFLLIRC